MNIHSINEVMARAGLECVDRIVADGRIHRFRVNGKRAKNGWYVAHVKGDDIFGAFGDWATGFQSAFGAKTKAIQQVLTQVKDRGEKRAEQAAQRANEQWSAAAMNPHNLEGFHPYLSRKKVWPLGTRIDDGNNVLVPMYRSNRIVGIQRINVDGEKRFTPGMKKLGSWFFIPGIGVTVVLCEGYATGASIHMATRLPVLVAFDCGNLLPAAREYEDYTKDRGRVRWIVAADNDQKTVGNPGLTKGFEAASELGGRLAMPRGTTGTDFNDLHLDNGLGAVCELIYGCL